MCCSGCPARAGLLEMTVGMIEAERRSQAGDQEPPETPEQAPFIGVTDVVRV